ncbi:MAG TPA: flagellar motor switch protein FliG [Nitrospirae bacterium]|nr:flagellar motor switch protein FliG [Nitrospirota bacterium]
MVVKDGKHYSGAEKAAIMLIAVGDKLAGKILEELDDTEISKISGYMTSLGNVPSNTVDEIAEEFVDVMESGEGGIVSGGRDYLRKMLESTMDPEKAADLLDSLAWGAEEEDTSGGGLEAVRNLDSTTIAGFLKNEHPQTCAIIMAHLDPQRAAQVIKELPERFQSEITFRLATLERIPPGVIKELDAALAQEFRSTGAMEGSQIGGVEAVAEIINNLDRTTESAIMSEVESINPELAENIRNLMFVFEDLNGIDARGMQTALKEINSDDLILALKTASEPLKEKIFSSMSERAALMMKEDLEAMGPVKISDVETAQASIIRVVKRLEEEGKVAIAGAGGEELV